MRLEPVCSSGRTLRTAPIAQIVWFDPRLGGAGPAAHSLYDSRNRLDAHLPRSRRRSSCWVLLRSAAICIWRSPRARRRIAGDRRTSSLFFSSGRTPQTTPHCADRSVRPFVGWRRSCGVLSLRLAKQARGALSLIEVPDCVLGLTSFSPSEVTETRRVCAWSTVLRVVKERAEHPW